MSQRIAEFKVGESITGFYLLRSFQRKTASNNNPFFHLVISDRSGSIDGRLFTVADLFDAPEAYKPGSVVKMRASVESFNGKTNLRIGKVRIATTEETEEHLPRLIRRSVRPPQVILSNVEGAIEELADCFPLEHALCSAILQTIPKERLERAAAAAKLHHAYIGGYLEHVFSLIESVQLLSGHYGLDVGTMTAIAFCHDIGKLYELSEVNGASEYTREGTLFGHISMGYSLVQQWAPHAIGKATQEGISAELCNLRIEAILHGILSHHGELEYGSPVVPATREAIAFHFIDNLDSKMAIEAEAWEGIAPDVLMHPERHYKLGTRLIRYPGSLRLRGFEDDGDHTDVPDGGGA